MPSPPPRGSQLKTKHYSAIDLSFSFSARYSRSSGCHAGLSEAPGGFFSSLLITAQTDLVFCLWETTQYILTRSVMNEYDKGIWRLKNTLPEPQARARVPLLGTGPRPSARPGGAAWPGKPPPAEPGPGTEGGGRDGGGRGGRRRYEQQKEVRRCGRV